MLNNWLLSSVRHFTMVCACAGLADMFDLCATAHAQNLAEEKKTNLVLLLEPQSDKDYSYRKVNHEKTIAIMLYGFKDQDQAQAGNVPKIPKGTKALDAFFRQHLDQVKRDYFTPREGQTMRLVAGDAAFTSAPMNRGQGLESAKMAGVTFPAGKLTFGGGYVWGEKNPAYMLPKADGLFVGASYDTGTTAFQFSYLTSGQEVMGMEVGGADYRYDNLMFGTSFRVNKRTAVTATLQYRNDSDPLTTDKRAAVFTLGTKWKF